MSDRVVEVHDLRKSYGDLEAVRGISFHVDRGEVFAMLGPNGAGKTTTTEILEGYRTRSAGDVTVLGHDPAKRERSLKERVGIVLQSTGIDPFLTVTETIEMYAGYYPSRRPTDEVIEVVGLAEKRDTRVNKLSGGQQRRLDVAIALAGDPELLFLDEPTTGFDPNARRNAWEVVKNLISIGKTVFLTTHFMDEAQYLADRVVVIAGGLIVAEGPPASIAGSRADADPDPVPASERCPRPRPSGAAAPGRHLGVAGRGERDDEDRARSDRLGPRPRLRAGSVRDHASDLGGRLPPADGCGGGHVNDVALTARQVRYTNRAFWRNPQAAFFTFAFPLMFLVIFTALLGGGTVIRNGLEFNQSTYYVASMSAFAIITACYTNLAISVTFQRDAGILKRTRGTPLPGYDYLTARVTHAIGIAVLLVVICSAFGAAFYNASIPSGVSLFRTVVVVLVGAGSFAALGLALTGAIPNADAAPPVVNATILPLLFISGVFIPIGDHAPKWVDVVGNIFPVRHLVDAFLGAYYGKPFFDFSWTDVGVVALWGVVGLVVAARTFSWEPRR